MARRVADACVPGRGQQPRVLRGLEQAAAGRTDAGGGFAS